MSAQDKFNTFSASLQNSTLKNPPGGKTTESHPHLKSWDQTNGTLTLVIQIENLTQLKSSEIRLKMKKTCLTLTVKDEVHFKVEQLYEQVIPTKTTSLRKGERKVFLIS